MKKIIITGASGTIGRVLIKCLGEKHRVIGIDKKPFPGVVKFDILREPARFKKLLKDAHAIIHLAWNIKEAGTSQVPSVPENKKMGELILQSASDEKVPRVILASSVHVSLGHIGYIYPKIVKDHRILHKKREIKVEDGFYPLGTYGASKVYLEALGKAYAQNGPKVIAVRLGNVTADNSFGEYPFWLSHGDLCQFVDKCLSTKKLPKFSTFFAVSNNECNPFDLKSPRKILEYKPKNSSPCPLNL